MSNSLKLVSAPVRESRLWDIPGYVPWFTADSATAIGVALRYLAVSLIGYKLTGSTTAAGWLGSLAAIAQQAAAVFGGTFADRHDRKTLIIVNATAGVICWGSVAALLMAGKLVFPVLLAIAVFESAVNGFLGPASDAMLKSVIDIRSYPKARSLNEGRDATINMAGSDFQSRTRQAFLDLAAAEPNRFHVIDASQSIEQVWSAIEADIQTLLRDNVADVDTVMARSGASAGAVTMGGVR